MKKQLFCLLAFFFITFVAQAQIKKKSYKVIPVLTNETFYLYGGLKAVRVSETATTHREFKLPEGTIIWYYCVKTSTKEGQKENLNLASTLTNLIATGGLSALSSAANAYIQSTSNAPPQCDVFLTKLPKYKLFKDEQRTDIINISKPEGTRKNFIGGLITIKNELRGTQCLVFQNPNKTSQTGISINLEVSAIIEVEEVDNSTWAKDVKNSLYDFTYQHLIKNNFSHDLATKLTECSIERITNEKTPADFDAMPQIQRDNYLTGAMNACIEKFNPKPTEEQEKASTYGSLGWKAYEKGNIDDAIEYSKKALSLNNNASMCWVKHNLGLFYLIKDEHITATDYYVEAISDTRGLDAKTAKTHLLACKDDIEKALSKYPNIKGYEIILEQIQSELKRY